MEIIQGKSRRTTSWMLSVGIKRLRIHADIIKKAFAIIFALKWGAQRRLSCYDQPGETL